MVTLYRENVQQKLFYESVTCKQAKFIRVLRVASSLSLIRSFIRVLF